jgi:hypothetical protein
MRTPNPLTLAGRPHRRAFRPHLALAASLLALGLLAGSGAASAATQLVRAPAAAPGLDELGLALDHSTREGDEVLFEASEADLALMKGAGIPYAVVIPDLESFYSERLLAERDLWQNAPRMTGFGFGSMGGYYTFAEVVAKLDEMRANYPSLITARQSIGVGQELPARDLWMVKISDNADASEEPGILYTAPTHAREPEDGAVFITCSISLEKHGT